MPVLTRLASLRNTLFRRAQLESDLDAELNAAVIDLSARFLEEGMDAAAARRKAIAALGGVANTKDSVRDVRIGAGLETWLIDLGYAARSLRRSLGLTMVLLITLGLGIGATVTLFAAVRTMLGQPLPYPNADRLVFIWLGRNQVGYRGPMAGSDLRDIRRGTSSFVGLGGVWASGTISLTGDGNPEQLRAALVTTNFFDVLGIRPALGRSFNADDSLDGAAPTILIGWDLFERRFGGDPSIVGRTIAVNDAPTTVIGVMPKGSRILLPEDASVPDRLQAFAPFWPNMEDGARGSMFLRVVGRLRDGVTLDAAHQDVAVVGQRISEEIGRNRILTTIGLRDDDIREIKGPLIALFVGVVILLLVACVNAAGLLVARAVARTGELHVRLALGASRRRLMRLLFLEGLVIAVAAGIIGLGLGAAGLAGLARLAPDSLTRFQAADIDATVVGFTAAVSVAIAAVISIVLPATIFAAARVETRRLDPRASTTRRSRTIRTVLVVAQVAMSAVLLVGAGLFVRGFIEVLRVAPGFSTEQQLTFRLSIPGRYSDSREHFNAFTTEMERKVAAIPGVTRVGAISHLPYDDMPNWSLTYGANAPLPPDAQGADSRSVSPGLFDALGIAPLAGRTFTEADSDLRRPVAVIDERLARDLWPGQNAIGQTFHTTTAGMNAPIPGPAALEVIGVVPHLRLRSLVDDLRPLIFLPWSIAQRNPMAFVLKTTRDPLVLAADVRAALTTLDDRVAIYDVRPLDRYVQDARSMRRFTTLLVALFAALALVLTLVGVYGVLAFAVTARRHEIGVRRAIGAQPGHILREVLRQGAVLTVAGCALGVLVAAVEARGLESLLYGVRAHDPLTFVTVAIVVVATGLIACLVPAWRATTIAPLDVLRSD